jgi:hypothetical protein
MVDSGLPPGDAAPDGSVEQPGIFVAVGNGGRRVRSLDDGTTWVDDQSLSLSVDGGADADSLQTVLWTGQQFAAFGYAGSRTMTSPDGMSWQDHASSGASQWFGGVAFGGGLYVVVGGFGMRAISLDGITWEEHDIPGDNVAAHTANSVLYDPAHQNFIATNDNGVRAYSSDGRAWTLSTGATGAMPTQLVMGNGIIIGAGGTSTVISTDGGVTWTNGGALPVAVNALVFGQGHFTGLGVDHVFTSVDGIVWTNHPINIQAQTVAYGHGVYILFYNETYRRSLDGISWVPSKTLSGSNGIQWITFGPTG